MESIEVLFCLQEVKAMSFLHAGGRGVFSREDAMGVIAKVIKDGFAVGVLVLEAKVGNNKGSYQQLVELMRRYYLSKSLAASHAGALAEMVVHEVCGNQKCQKCKGTGQSFSKRFNTLCKCGRCEGTGMHFYTMREYVTTFGLLAKEPTNTADFRKRFYDHLMDGIDSLEREQGNAAKRCVTVQEMALAEDKL